MKVNTFISIDDNAYKNYAILLRMCFIFISQLNSIQFNIIKISLFHFDIV